MRGFELLLLAVVLSNAQADTEIEAQDALHNLHKPFSQCVEGSCIELGAGTKLPESDHGSFEGYATDSQTFYGAATSPCVLEDFKASLEYGEGYYYSTYNNGWCRRIESENVYNVRVAYDDGAWAAGIGTTYLPIDDAEYAKCRTTLEGVTSGQIDCTASQTECMSSEGWRYTTYHSIDRCFPDGVSNGNQISCPDGVGPDGVYVTSRIYSSEEKGYCTAWSSVSAARGYMDCTPDKKTCTKVHVHKAHMMRPSTGILMMKRFKCFDSGKCKVFKIGRCFDVSPSVPFSHCSMSNWQGCVYTDGDSYGPLELQDDTRAFADLAVQQMKAGTVKSCTGNDLALAEAFIKQS